MNDLERIVAASLSEATKDKLALLGGGALALGILALVGAAAYKSSVNTKKDADIERMRAMKENGVDKFNSKATTSTKTEKSSFDFSDSFDATISSEYEKLPKEVKAYLSSPDRAEEVAKARRAYEKAMKQQLRITPRGTRAGSDVVDVPYKAHKKPAT